MVHAKSRSAEMGGLSFSNKVQGKEKRNHNWREGGKMQAHKQNLPGGISCSRSQWGGLRSDGLNERPHQEVYI